MIARPVQVEPGLRLGFPDRAAEFVDGVEIGVLASLIATGAPVFDHTLSAGNLDQARDLVSALGYRLVVSGQADGRVTIRVSRTSIRPRFTLAG